MQLIENEFTGKSEMKNYNFKLYKKNEKAFIFEVSDLDKNIHYEVFEKKIQKPKIVNLGGKTIEYLEKEMYPKKEDFGVWAWCFINLSDAIKKYNESSK